MRLSLLRAPTHPDPTADQGRHSFTYALMPHPGSFREAGVIQAAEDLNAPLRMVRTNLPSGTSRSLIEVDTPQVVVEAIKRAEDSDAVIVRLYEAWGRRCTARIRTTLPASRTFLCDLLERDREAVAVHDGINRSGPDAFQDPDVEVRNLATAHDAVIFVSAVPGCAIRAGGRLHQRVQRGQRRRAPARTRCSR